ncbi:Fic family protein [Desulfofundulus sp. TPOSR]|uniref:Fic family protein n=1 Tax=Desulfofundulus sp. TPOSR TaxID=2714340 RepID=UPI00140D90B6|nr:Fic family protein [Desulfofundulus sp. TPOSR]NHM26840.1 Fic family protein [Desulfofundulus sp. TPOSR]
MKPEDFPRPNGRIIRIQDGGWAFIPNPLPPAINWTPQLVAELSAADRAIGELSGLGKMIPNPHLLIKPFLRHEAVLSSRIEGTQASLSDLYVYEASGQLRLWNGDLVRKDVPEVFNYVRALEYGLQRLKELPVSLRLLRELHALLLEEVRGAGRSPGEFRRVQNWIGPPGSTLANAVFVPPPVSKLPALLDSFEKFLHEDIQLPPLLKLAMIHYQFEAIHPFLDGNGRLGRMLIVLLLCAWDILPQPLLYLSPYFESQRASYYDLLQAVNTSSAWESWFIFFLRGIRYQARDAITRATKLQELQVAYRERFQRSRISGGLLSLCDLLFSFPVVSIPQVAQQLNVTYSMAKRYMENLIKEGVLYEITGRNRNRLYMAREIIAILEKPPSLASTG